MPERPQEKETLGERVIRLREARGWTRAQLADKAGIHPSHVGLIERAVRVGVRKETLEKLAAAFGITVARLIGEDDTDIQAADLEPYREAIEAASRHGLDPDQLLQLINTMATMLTKMK